MSPTRHVSNVWWWMLMVTVASLWVLSDESLVATFCGFNKHQKKAVVAAPKHCQKTSPTSLVYTCPQLTASDWSVPAVTITSSWCHSSVPVTSTAVSNTDTTTSGQPEKFTRFDDKNQNRKQMTFQNSLDIWYWLHFGLLKILQI